MINLNDLTLNWINYYWWIVNNQSWSEPIGIKSLR